MSIYERVTGAYEDGRQRVTRNRLQELTSAYLAAPQEQRQGFASQFAALDPDAGLQIQALEAERQQAAMTAQQSEQEKRRLGAGKFAQYLTGIRDPERRQQIAGMYSNQFGDQFPQDLSDEGLGAFASMTGAAGDASKPFVLAPGSSLIGPQGNLLYQNPGRPERFPIVQVPDGQGGMLSMRDTPDGLVPLSGGAPAAPALPFRVNLQGLTPESVQAARQSIEADMGRSTTDAEWAQISGQQGSPRGSFGYAPPKANAATFRPLTPQEISQRGFPEGTSAQINEQTGETKILRAPDAATLKDQRAIRDKAPRLGAIVRSLANVSSALTRLSRGDSTFGLTDTGPIDRRLAALTPEGNLLTQAVGELQPNLMALTRVAGIGSQSDLDSRLDLLRYPNLENLPEANQQALTSLGFFVRDLADAYVNAGDEATAEKVRAMQAEIDKVMSGDKPVQKGFRVLSQRPAGG